MSTLFENPTVPLDSLPSVEEISWSTVESRYRDMALLKNLLFSLLLIPIVGGVVFLFFLTEQSPVNTTEHTVLMSLRFLVGIGTVVLVAFLLFRWFVIPFLEVPRMKYAVRLEDINYRRGVFSTKTTSAPFRRMQHAETNRGPLERMFDLASLSVFTAAGLAVQIRGLSPETAEALRDHVLKKISEFQQVDSDATENDD
ncbi:MAG: PH domain-containing protein [Gammaproteobacteria bacterium]|nr:PH domain-containing protein [Gammaproteobacteria bacterium]